VAQSNRTLGHAPATLTSRRHGTSNRPLLAFAPPGAKGQAQQSTSRKTAAGMPLCELRPEYVISHGALPAQWVNGTPNEAALQCHCLDEHGRTWVFRFSKWQGVVHSGDAEYKDAYEGNFCFCFVGDTTAVLLDTGPVPRSALKAALEALLPSPGTLDLVVAHTHSHDDHVAGDRMWSSAAPSPFKSIRIVGHAPSAVIDFFAVPPAPATSALPYTSFEDCSLKTAQFDLGGRALELFHIPGHEPAAIAAYDPSTNVLVTGDNLYPGRCAAYNVQRATCAAYYPIIAGAILSRRALTCLADLFHTIHAVFMMPL
jgi:glyoxylase-like metal-dependent hydrolase (beta-lactamase superfamily II)